MQTPSDFIANTFHSLLSTITSATAIINTEGEILFWNDGAENMYNIKKEAIVGKKIKEFFQPENLIILNVLETKQPVLGAYHRPIPDKHVIINASPIYDAKQQLIGAVSIERDISTTVRLNEKLAAASNELQHLKKQVKKGDLLNPFQNIIGSSDKIQKAIRLGLKVAKTNATVMILGESGVGKELFAQAIHEASSRKDKRLIPINCGAIPPALFESEFFGYEKGAYTGANKDGQPGKLELANGGTLFLDEIGELPLDMQVKLLRSLQENEIYRIGGKKPIKIDIRIIVATNRDLEEMVQKGEFRSDLYYRLNIFPIHVPALRDRKKDIPLLVDTFLYELVEKYNYNVSSLGKEVLHLLYSYDWPGNIRELKNFIERLLIINESDEITTADILQLLPDYHVSHNETLVDEKNNLEKERIIETLEQTFGNKTAAAKKLGISRATLYQRIKKYEIVS